MGPPAKDEDNALPNGVAGLEIRKVTKPNSTELCNICSRLDLNLDKFILKDERLRDSARIARPASLAHYSPKSRNLQYSLGTLAEIVAKSDSCPLCSLVAISSNPTTHEELLKSTCFANWEVDGRTVTEDGPLRARTRRIHLRWDNPSLKDSYLVLVAPKRYLRFNSDAAGVWEKDALFLGREFEPGGSNHVLMKSWLDSCTFDHGPKCSTRRDREFEDMVEQSYFGVVDVLDMRLTSLPMFSDNPSDDARITSPPSSPGSSNPDDHIGPKSFVPYVALSYVWGEIGKGKEPYTTDLSNILVHQVPGGLEKVVDQLPVVIRDAIDLVRRLGLRYIWIDSLCIIQNSNRSWQLNAKAMDLIYGNACLTICAADGLDSSTGLKAMHPSTRIQHVQECAPGVKLMVSHLAETGIQASKWNTRAWTFQERLLSRRCLIFTEGRVFFQCPSTMVSEDIVPSPNGTGWSLDFVQAPSRVLLELSARAIWVYSHYVSLYSARELSKPKDILAAFEGVSNLISKHIKAPFVFGLPSSHFDFALLWEPIGRITRRAPKPEDKESFGGLEFPSWSWCGWMGATIKYNNNMLEGCLDDIHEWLTEHTWISWFIRDGHGNLRPLWDDEKSAENRATESRWRGYKGNLFLDGPNVEAITHPRDWSKPGYESYENCDRRGHHERGNPNRMDGRERGKRVIIYEAPSDFHQQQADLRDSYGRELSSKVANRCRKEFRQTLPESPFRIIKADYTSKPDIEFPDQAFLQFWTWSTSLHLVPSDNDHKNIGDGLVRYDIADEIGDWCGSIILDEEWVARKEQENKSDFDGSSHEFIAISDAKAFTYDECNTWTYYIPKEREQSEWDLYYVLLIEKNKPNDRISHRVALGKVFQAAFENNAASRNCEWKEIIFE
ncbi:MAG: hypothetical protein Q9187_007790 [Circinaria calcarea]